MASASRLTARGAPNILKLAALSLAHAAIAGCHHKQVARRTPPQALPPPPQVYAPPARASASPSSLPPARIPITPVPPGGVSADDLEYVATHTPILTEVGLATWYTAPYAGRKAANGQVFSDAAMTAAHRTLPMGSLVVVTNMKTGQSGVMRITDRGPFVDGRMLDVTIAAAKATGIYRTGMAQVRLDVYETPKPINSGGRWCVQIGAFHSEREALELKQELLQNYSNANVIEFAGQDSYWVRIRPQGDNREWAEYIAQHIQPTEGEAYLTRLD
jgi:rare lipoprotein A